MAREGGREGGRKGKGSELERASKHLLSNPALLRRRVFFGRSDLSPPCPPSTGELPPEIQFRKFLCATVSSPRGPRGMRSQTMDVHAPPCLHSPLGSGDLASTEQRVTENNGYFARL